MYQNTQWFESIGGKKTMEGMKSIFKRFENVGYTVRKISSNETWNGQWHFLLTPVNQNKRLESKRCYSKTELVFTLNSLESKLINGGNN